MKLVRRRLGSQRASKPITVQVESNWSGQGGNANLTFQDETGMFYIFTPESISDVRILMSCAHIIHHNFGDQS